MIKVRYHNPFLKRIEKIEQGDWIDLRAAQEVEISKGGFKLISLGISMELPEGYEAHVVPRSSTLKHFGITQANSMGVVDNSYCGDSDIWFFPAIAHRQTTIRENDRICQFRIIKKQPVLIFEEVEKLEGKARGGHGSTGVK